MAISSTRGMMIIEDEEEKILYCIKKAKEYQIVLYKMREEISEDPLQYKYLSWACPCILDSWDKLEEGLDRLRSYLAKLRGE